MLLTIAHFPAVIGFPITLAWVLKKLGLRLDEVALVEKMQRLFIGVTKGLVMESS